MRTTMMMRVAALACAFWMSGGACAQSEGEWAHRKKLTIDSTAAGADLRQGTGPLPLAIRLHTGNFPFPEAKPDGSDLRFTAPDGKTPLGHHIERYDAASELAVVWVQVPKIAPDTQADGLWLQWGNPKASAAGDAKATYDAAQTLVLHFAEDKPPRDATGNGNHARESTARAGAAGPLGAAASFDGNARVVIPASPTLRSASPAGWTFTAWVKPADAGRGTLFEQGGAKGLAVRLVDGALAAAVPGGREVRANAKLQGGVWQHVAVVAGGGKLELYVNGEPQGSAAAPAFDVTGEVTLGAGYRGDLDELTLAAAARSADYVKALYASQQPDGALVAFADEEVAEASSSYLGILLSAVTLDGWIVIGVLGIMFVVSFWVMIGKARFISRVRRANGAFLERFREDPGGALEPGTHGAAALLNDTRVQDAPILRLYAIGLREIEHRYALHPHEDERFALSAAALDSIRAAMDAGLVRENQRLNSQIVLLTIAISGGPFLGLLGTVIGVMITFAAIAAAGDVNVNSIAPGIAAALVATVAGLAVAIPALFGYNWLTVQIRNAAADTQVFADEFLTKAAELHAA